MLSDPNVSQILSKVGNRYEAALALAKRARNIEKKREIEGDRNIKDAVDIAGCEIAEERAFVKMNGKYIVQPPKDNDEEVDIEE
ncbi:MAG: DNA-directed RNA polymerase subunit omega [Clostridia bacterium]